MFLSSVQYMSKSFPVCEIKLIVLWSLHFMDFCFFFSNIIGTQKYFMTTFQFHKFDLSVVPTSPYVPDYFNNSTGMSSFPLAYFVLMNFIAPSTSIFRPFSSSFSSSSLCTSMTCGQFSDHRGFVSIVSILIWWTALYSLFLQVFIFLFSHSVPCLLFSDYHLHFYTWIISLHISFRYFSFLCQLPLVVYCSISYILLYLCLFLSFLFWNLLFYPRFPIFSLYFSYIVTRCSVRIFYIFSHSVSMLSFR